MPNIPATYLAIIKKALFSLVVLLLTLGINRAASNLLKARFKDPSHMFTLRMLVRNTLLIIGCAAILSIWLEFGHSLAVAGGIVGAGIAFASREVIGCFAGYLSIVTGNLFQIGDRIRIGDVNGDVLDISLLRTTVMEIGEWVKADQYTGRTVTIANSAVFSDPVFNYTQHWRYLWDEIMIPVTYTSNWHQAAEMMLEQGKKCSSPFLTQAQAELGDMMEHYPVLPDTPMEPMIFITMTDNWIEMTLRYIVEAWQRRTVRAQLHRELLQCFEAEPAITVASATYDIVGFPPLKGDIGPGQ
jgi:small-conductance mechanosensitive channel